MMIPVKLLLSEENMYMKAIYDKPEIEGKPGIFKTLAHYFKLKIYKASIIDPVVKRLRDTSPTFLDMCEFGDFIRLIEKVFFYDNNLRMASDTSPMKNRLLSANKIDGTGEKNLVLDMEKDKVSVTFEMKKKFNKETGGYDEYIEEGVYFNTSTKLRVQFVIINREIEFYTTHDWNMARNINLRLQSAMADLFLEYYLKM